VSSFTTLAIIQRHQRYGERIKFLRTRGAKEEEKTRWLLCKGFYRDVEICVYVCLCVGRWVGVSKKEKKRRIVRGLSDGRYSDAILGTLDGSSERERR